MDVYLHLVIVWPSKHRPRFEDESVFSSGNGVHFPHCLCLLQEPRPQHPTWKVQMNLSARPEHQGALWSTILLKYSHPACFSRGEKWILGHWRNSGTVCKRVSPGNFSTRFFLGECLAWSSSLLAGFFHQAWGYGNQEGAAVSSLCDAMTVIHGVVMAAYFPFLWTIEASVSSVVKGRM